MGRKNRPAAPRLFQDELKQALPNIAAHPSIGTSAKMRADPDVRVIVLRKSRYVVFYDVVDEVAEIHVVGVGIADYVDAGIVLQCYRRTNRATKRDGRVEGTMNGSSGRYASKASRPHVRAIRVPHFARRVLVITLGIASMVSAVACRKMPPTTATEPPPAEPPAAETPAARQFKAWLTVFNAGDRDALVAYHEKHFPYEVASDDVHGIDREFGLSQGTGGFDLKKPENPTSTSIVAILKERRSDQFARASMEVDPAAPHRVVRFEIHPIPTPQEFRPHMSEAEALVALRTELEKLTAADQFSGAVIVAKDGVPIFAEAYGFADRDKKLENTLDTRFRIGSMNKMFTAVATLQLVQGKKLALTDALTTVLAKYPSQDLAKKATIHHLLTHTAGAGDIFGPDFDKHRLELRTLADYVKLYGTRELAFEPGAKLEYSNYGFLLLGIVIEAVSKQTYFDYVERRVFKPAGMTSTSSPMEDKATEPNRSVGYMRDPKAGWQPNTDTLPIRATSAGGGDSTVKDLLAFANALTSNKLLDAEHTKLLTTGKVEMDGPTRKYGYGFMESIEDGRRCFGHGGGAPGMNGQLTICDNGYTIVVLANLDPPAAARIEHFMLHRLPIN